MPKEMGKREIEQFELIPNVSLGNAYSTLN